MVRLRPVIETGYENLVQARSLYQQKASEEEMLADWQAVLSRCMHEWGETRAELVEVFGRERDMWIESDLDSWLFANRMFDGVPEAMGNAVSAPESELSVHIVTTKQAHFTKLLFEKLAGILFPEERIHSTTVSGTSKTDVLKQLQSDCPAEERIIVEDKLSTLEKVQKENELAGWELLFADWGYCTDSECERVRRGECGRVKLISLGDFNKEVLRPRSEEQEAEEKQ